ncbi:DUF3800 domain-containing protein [Intestinibacter bartlettii]|uniref:DUF3800 domain-containing protein n=1 Tax=Intestinibacter bartlettii TaxID=261299 RepID=UPI003219CAC7
MININVNDRKKKRSMLSGYPLFEERFTFFYDETGNCRKFLLNDDGVNYTNALKNNFILGGVAFEGTTDVADFEKLREVLHFEEGQKELKFKHLYKKSKNFLTFMNSDRASGFLNWLSDNNLYIHYCTMNNLYYSLVDIVDSLYENYRFIFKDKNMIVTLKNALYDFAIAHCDEILDFLYRYKYPDVKNCRGFCEELCQIISTYNNNKQTYPDFFLECLMQMIKQVGKENKLIFIQDNEPLLLISEYYLLYIDRCIILSKSTHIFDEEKTIEDHFKDIKLLEDKKEIKNYKFVKSHENLYIQVSDMLVGMLSKLFIFLDETSSDSLIEYKNNLSEKQINNFCLLYNLIKKSDMRCKYFFYNINPVNIVEDRISKLRILAK